MKPILHHALVCLLLGAAGILQAQEAPPAQPLTAALLPFQERGLQAKGEGELVMELLFAELVAAPDLTLVDRADLASVLKELELGAAGMVDGKTAARLGHLTGAKVLVTGSVLAVGKSKYVVAKIISTETSRVLGDSAKGSIDAELTDLVEELAPKLQKLFKDRAKDLVVKPAEQKDRIGAINEQIGKGKRPTLHISIAERHVGQATIDPAAETELALVAKACGFELVDDADKADVLLKGEGFSEFAVRRGNLITVKARVEVKAVQVKTSKVLASDRQTTIMVDLAEQIAGKSALQEAAMQIAERMLPTLAPGKRKKDK